MKLTLWQQFSSNHSGYFWVVGTFDTPDEARRAFTELRTMLFEISNWHSSGEIDDDRDVADMDPFPPEEEYADKYGIEWEAAIDWWTEDEAETLIDNALSIAGRSVIVQNPAITWNTTNPFREILDSMGAETSGYDAEGVEYGDEAPIEPHPRCTFTATNTETADRLEATLTAHFAGSQSPSENPPPWNDDEANFAQVLPTSQILNADHIDLLKKRWQHMYDTMSKHPSPFVRRLPAERLALSRNNMQLRRSGLNFTIDELWFHNEALGVSALIAWLEVNGCTNIDFRYLTELD